MVDGSLTKNVFVILMLLCIFCTFLVKDIDKRKTM